MLTRTQKVIIYLTLSIAAFLMVFPFLWSIISSFKFAHEIMAIPPTFWPENFTLTNYYQVFNSQGSQFGNWYKNSLICSSLVTASVCFFSALAGYSLAKFEYPHKEKIFYTILSTMMVPMQMLIIPWYIMFTHLKLNDTLIGIMLPGLISAFGIFLLRQAFERIPNSLVEAARLDGASEFTIFRRIMFPLIKPSVAALGIITFVGNWDAFLWPMIITDSSHMKTLPVGLQAFAGQFGVEFHLIMAAANLVVIPSIIIFIVFQKHIIGSIASSGVKG